MTDIIKTLDKRLIATEISISFRIDLRKNGALYLFLLHEQN
jgi:hypothetical protein